jgi:hypothetical protein
MSGVTESSSRLPQRLGIAPFQLRDITRHFSIRKEQVQCFTRNLQFNWVSSSWIEPFNAILNQDHNLNPFLISLSTQSLRRNESFHLGNLHNNWASLFGSSLFESSLHFLSLNKQTSDLSFTFPHASCCCQEDSARIHLSRFARAA